MKQLISSAEAEEVSIKLNNPFQTFSKEYDDWFDSHHNIYQSELNAVSEFIKDGSTGVEIGAGSGRFSVPLNIPVGVEPSDQMADIARSKGLQIIKAAAESLPFDNESFDFSLFVTTICFLQDVEKSFKEAYRITRSSGFIIVALIDKNSSLGKLYRKKKKESPFYKNANFFSVKQVVNLLKKAGYNDFSFRQTLDTFDNENIQKVEEGYGHGGFVVIKANKL